MKILLTPAFFCLVVTAFAQNNNKDTTALNYGARIYDARIGRSMSVDPKASQNNPYQFAEQKTASDTTVVKQPVDKPKKKTIQ